ARETVDLVTSVARQTTVLIRRIQVRMSSERAGTLLRRLVEVEQTLHPEMGVKALLAAIVEAAVRLMGARTGGAFVNHRERRELEARVLLPPLPEGLLCHRLSHDSALVSRVVRDKEIVLEPGYGTSPWREPLFEGLVFGTLIAVPLILAERVEHVLF